MGRIMSRRSATASHALLLLLHSPTGRCLLSNPFLRRRTGWSTAASHRVVVVIKIVVIVVVVQLGRRGYMKVAPTDSARVLAKFMVDALSLRTRSTLASLRRHLGLDPVRWVGARLLLSLRCHFLIFCCADSRLTRLASLLHLLATSPNKRRKGGVQLSSARRNSIHQSINKSCFDNLIRYINV